MDILGRIIQLREERGWSEYQLADKSGIAQSTISSWYRKHLHPSSSSLEKICKGFQIPISQFFAEGEEAVCLTAQQKQLLESWGRLSSEQKKVMLELLENL